MTIKDLIDVTKRELNALVVVQQTFHQDYINLKKKIDEYDRSIAIVKETIRKLESIK